MKVLGLYYIRWDGGRLEVFIHRKRSVVFCSDSCLLVLTDTALEEVDLALHTDHLHPRERVACFVVLGEAQGNQQVIGNTLNVLAHLWSIHPRRETGVHW